MSRALLWNGLFALVYACSSHSALSGDTQSAAKQHESVPPARSNASKVADLCVGSDHACALLGERVMCWGDNSWHQLSASFEPQFESPRAVDLPAAEAIACGRSEVCSRTRSGEVHCRGLTPASERLALPAPAKDLALFDRGGCAALVDARVFCWDQPLALAGPTILGPQNPDKRALWELKSAAPALGFVPRSAFSERVCVRKSAGVSCFENLEAHEFAREVPGEPEDAAKPELAASAPHGATKVGYGFDHGCALVDGAVQCWGAASEGQLGNGEKYLHPVPVRVTGVDDVKHIDAGDAQACASTGQSLSCWGVMRTPQGTSTYQFTPHHTSAPDRVLDLQAARVGYPGSADEHTMLPTRVRTPSGWWMLGPEWGKAKPPAPAALARREPRAKAISPDGACGLIGVGKLTCLQRVRVLATRTSLTDRIEVASPSPLIELTSLIRMDYVDHVCARTSSGRVVCFAMDKRTDPRVQSSALDELQEIEQISAAESGVRGVVCALDRAGAVYCWGDGSHGQLGSKVPVGAFEPRRIDGLPPIDDVRVGGTYACALARSGDVYCWGSNRTGNVPDGALGRHDAPVRVAL